MTKHNFTKEDLEIAEEFKRHHSRWICSAQDVALLIATFQHGGTVMMDDSTIQLARRDCQDHFVHLSDEQMREQVAANINRAFGSGAV